MLRRIFNIVITIPIAIILVVFMVANRQSVTLSLDPTSSDSPAIALQIPMFMVIFTALIIGIILGGFVVWWKQGAYRKLARKEHKEAQMWHKMADKERKRADEFDPMVKSGQVAPGLAKLSQL